MLNYVDSCSEIAVETIQTIIVFSPAIPIVIVILVSLIVFASSIPQYFKDLKDSRDKKNLEIMRQNVTEEVYKERDSDRCKIQDLQSKNRQLEEEVDRQKHKIFSYDHQLKQLEKVRNMLAK
jgi:predicted RNase H-like nuclease (RuvC/YqgF family)